MTTSALLLTLVLVQAPSGDLGVADLAEYRAALFEPGRGPTARVSFHELWNGDATYRGRQVQVEGRVVRRFEQPEMGSLPALTETWVATPGDNPICLVSPTTSGSRQAALGSWARFEGTYLRRIRYAAGDTPRLAPLVVGCFPPRVMAPARSGLSATPARDPTMDWVLGLGIGLVVLFILLARHAMKPDRHGPNESPPIEFQDGGVDEAIESEG